MNYLVIPAYEPDIKLLHLLRKVREKSDFHIIVIDDGSGDNYQPLFQRVQEYATVLTHSVNQGKGAALKKAFEHLAQLEPGIIVTADSDGQHKVWDIFRVGKAAQNHTKQLVLGTRSFSGKVPFRSRFGNSLTKLLFKWQTGTAISDTQTGLRAFHSQLLPWLLKIPGQRYEYEMNMLLAASQELEMVQVPIETVYIDHNSGSHFRPLLDGLTIYRQLFAFTLSSLGSFIVDYLVYALSLILLAAVPTALRILLANSLARVTSSIVNFSSNKRMVFHNQDSIYQTGASYFSLALFLFIADTFLIQLLHASFGWNLLLTKVIVGFLLFNLSWLAQKKIIFKERTRTVS